VHWISLGSVVEEVAEAGVVVLHVVRLVGADVVERVVQPVPFVQPFVQAFVQ
jgi:hypothetical protein